MKKFLNLILSFLLFSSTLQSAFAEFTVVPAEPFSRQFNIELPPGEKFSGAVIVKNLSTKPMEIKAYGADATHSNQGTFALTTLSKEQKSIGEWVNFLEEKYTLDGREEKSIPFNISIPQDATPGNYSGGIAVESIEEKTGAVSSSARIYVKMFLNIPGEKSFGFNWNTFEYKPPSSMNHPTFTLGIKNNGNTIIIAEPVIEIYGFPPLKTPNLDMPAVMLQPGIDVPNIEKKWEEFNNFGYYWVTAKVTFSEMDIVSNTKINSVTHTKKMVIQAIPLPVIFLTLLAILAIIIIPVYKYKRYWDFKKSCEIYTVQGNDTLGTIATNRNIPWKKLVKMNGLKPPYTLGKGQKLMVPKNNPKN